MKFWDFFGFLGLALGAGAYVRIDALEKKLKEQNILKKDFSSE